MRNYCSVPDCANPHKAKGFCNKHYQQHYRTGSADVRVTALEWLLENANHASDECLQWPFSFKGNGYGQVAVNGKNSSAHRVACELANGLPPSDEYDAAHNCGNRACVNGRHLRWATAKENSADRIIHGTHREGEKAGPAKLTNEQAREIQVAAGKQRDIARLYGVTQKVVSLIKRGKTYRAALGMA